MEFRLCVFENRVLRRIFGPKRDELTGEWRRLHNEELYVLYSSPNIIRATKSRRWTRYVARILSRRGAYRTLLGKPEGRRPLKRPIKCVGLVHDRYRWRAIVCVVMNMYLP